jgi:thymidine kinase
LEQLSMGEGYQLVVYGLGEDFKVGHFQGLSGL